MMFGASVTSTYEYDGRHQQIFSLQQTTLGQTPPADTYTRIYVPALGIPRGRRSPFRGAEVSSSGVKREQASSSKRRERTGRLFHRR